MITIITVCFNAAKDMEKTIQSVIAQENCEIEYIIKDGASTDDTKALVRQYEPQLRKLKNFVFVSDEDAGLYDAMNTATQMAQGEFVLFLNSGDCFVDKNTVSYVENGNFEGELLYGDMVQVSEGRYHLCKANRETVENFPRNMNFSHQALFIKTDVMKELKYDTHYRLCADYDFFQKAYANGKIFRYIDRPICVFQMGGLSYQRAFDVVDEINAIQLKYGVISLDQYHAMKKKNQWKRMSRRLLPSGMYNQMKAWKRKWNCRNWSAELRV